MMAPLPSGALRFKLKISKEVSNLGSDMRKGFGAAVPCCELFEEELVLRVSQVIGLDIECLCPCGGVVGGDSGDCVVMGYEIGGSGRFEGDVMVELGWSQEYKIVKNAYKEQKQLNRPEEQKRFKLNHNSFLFWVYTKKLNIRGKLPRDDFSSYHEIPERFAPRPSVNIT